MVLRLCGKHQRASLRYLAHACTRAWKTQTESYSQHGAHVASDVKLQNATLKMDLAIMIDAIHKLKCAQDYICGDRWRCCYERQSLSVSLSLSPSLTLSLSLATSPSLSLPLPLPLSLSLHHLSLSIFTLLRIASRRPKRGLPPSPFFKIQLVIIILLLVIKQINTANITTSTTTTTTTTNNNDNSSNAKNTNTNIY